MCVLYEKVVGVTFKNDDGSSRQKYILQLSEGDQLYFEQYEYDDCPAIRVLDSDEHCIGHCSKELVPKLLEYYSNGYTIDVTVEKILGLDELGELIDGYNAGVEMAIDIFHYSEKPTVTSTGTANPTLSRPDAVNSALSGNKSGRIMIFFGLFFLLGFFVAFNPVVLLLSVLLLFFGFRRHKVFKAKTKRESR